MQAVFLKLLNMSITASWLVLAVIVLRLVFKKAPKSFRVILWALVGIRLICPFSVESVFSLIPSAETVPVENLYSEIPIVDSGISAINEAVNTVIEEHFGTVSGEISNSGAEKDNNTSGVTAVNPVVNIAQITSLAWMIGMAGMILYTGMSYLRIYRKIREAVPFYENIWLCDYISTPFILGVIRPQIFLPSTMDEQDMSYVIAHEKAHLKRRDHWWKPLGFLLLSIYWFNPVMWIAYALLCRDIELACDEKVIREMGSESKKPYSDALINCSVPRKMIAACPLAFGEVSVKNRIKSVLNYKKPGFWIMVVVVAVSIMVAVCFLTDPPGSRLDEKLQVFIDCQIASHNQSEKSKDYFCCVDWEVLGTERSGNRTTVYLWALYQEYSYDNGLKEGCGSHIPVAITVEYGGYNYELVEYWMPRDGSYWVKDIWDKFPTYLWGKATDSQRYIKEQLADCERMAKEHFERIELENGADAENNTETATSETPNGQFYDYTELPDFSAENVIRYVYKYSVDSMDPVILLDPDNQTFRFTYSGLSSFLNFGTYQVFNDTLTLQVDGGLVYLFRLDEAGNYVFDASKSSPIQRFRYAANESKGMEPVPDGAVFERVVSADELLLRWPPDLVVVQGQELITAACGNVEWDFEQEDGTRATYMACGSTMLASAERLNALELKYKDVLSVRLQFGVDPDRITVTCWNLDEENPEGEMIETDNVRGFDLKDGNYVYCITAEWESYGRFGGKAEYGFRTKYVSE